MSENVIAALVMALAMPAGIMLTGLAAGVPLELAALAPLAWATASLAAALVLGRPRRAPRHAHASETRVSVGDDLRPAA
jgi:hypothetical protein